MEESLRTPICEASLDGNEEGLTEPLLHDCGHDGFTGSKTSSKGNEEGGDIEETFEGNPTVDDEPIDGMAKTDARRHGACSDKGCITEDTKALHGWNIVIPLIGLTMFCAAVALTVVGELGKAHSPPASKQVITGIYLGLINVAATFLILKPIMYFLMMQFTIRCMGFSRQDYYTMVDKRDEWSIHQTLFVEKYGERKIKMNDAIRRRFAHIVNIMKNFAIFTDLVSTLLGPLTSVVAIDFEKFLTTAIKFSVALWGGNGFLARVVFRSARVRDGKVGRINLLNVYALGLGTDPLCIVILNIFLGTNSGDQLGSLVRYIYMPVAWGDTAAELVGSFFGSIEFRVKGFGEVNRKTLEGVVACFVVSYVCLVISALDPNFPKGASWRIDLQWVHVISALVATIMETISLRSTDNSTMVFLSWSSS